MILRAQFVPCTVPSQTGHEVQVTSCSNVKPINDHDLIMSHGCRSAELAPVCLRGMRLASLYPCSILSYLATRCAALHHTMVITSWYVFSIHVSSAHLWTTAHFKLMARSKHGGIISATVFCLCVCSRKTLIFLILTLNHIYPDYDFSQLRAHHFKKLESRTKAEETVDSHLLEVSQVSYEVAVHTHHVPGQRNMLVHLWEAWQLYVELLCTICQI